MLVGIDLGTTNSLIGAWVEDKPRLIQNAFGEVLTPSVVGLDDAGGLLVGAPAKDRLISHPHLTAAGFKRYMGTQYEVQLGTRRFRAEELSALVLRSLKEDAEAFLGAPVTEAVITVPAYFNDTQRKATLAAGKLAGLHVERLLNEPTAAALSHGLANKNAETKYLVFDLGGGTFDVSIVELFDGVIEVHASSGDNFLGGDDFRDQLVKLFLAEHAAALKIDPLKPPQALLERTSRQAELAKRKLTNAQSAQMCVTWEEQELRWDITAADFERHCEALLNRLSRPIQQALRDARLRTGQLDEVVLVGGATRMPMIRKLVTKLFGRFPVVDINPDEAIAQGAAIQAALKARNSALNDVVMTDVCPYSMGVEIARQVGEQQFEQGLYAPILERNSHIPISREERFNTLQDNQTQINLRVFQGENPLVKNNILLGEINVKVPKGPARQQCVDVRFTYDLDGLLEVEVTVVASGEKQRLVIEGNPGVLSKEEIDRRFAELSKLKLHPRNDLVNKQLLARAERAYEESLGAAREAISSRLVHFQSVISRQERREIARAREEFESFLNELETDR
ncbi:molecular chaperone HscC [Steroidobacter agaridevorans]|uniref:Molecular chaperone HscC n=1 Tax=Steroidobacter agaridevorans TaxID=2695856 RepID=A0A829YKP7_9GAMM|nr:molecular chaperone HscC [Steroidobacter agaridevorans]GFE83885.1 molecular chaperone HscC [Steroidobacter agaridevorans]GFE91336.1 molecular chaperone HscC [Steroidobacter agaridevorans]